MFVVLGVRAQNNQPAFSYDMVAFTWNINFPISNQFVNKTSFDGFKLDYRKMIQPDLSVGLELGWCGFDKYTPRKTYQIHNGAVTTDFYSYLYTIPMAVNAHHYFKATNMIYPYAGLALGAMYSEDELYYNTYVTSYYNWGFLVSPELGAIIKFSQYSGAGLIIGVNYSYATNKQKEFNIDGIQSFGVQIGLVVGK
jgi:hypothetical protein